MSVKKKNKGINQPVIILDLEPKLGLFKAIYNQAMDYGYGVLDLKITHETIPEGTNVAGLLTNRPADDPLICTLRKDGCQVVRLRTYPKEKENKEIQAVVSNVAEAGKLAADHFADCQFRNVGFVGNFPLDPAPLFHAFHEQVMKRECKCHVLQLKAYTKKNPTPKEQFEHIMKQILKWLKKVPKPIAVFTYNDLIAAGIYTTAKLGGFAVPEDVALLGYGNDKDICEYLPVPLSSIDTNGAEQGRIATKILHQLIIGEATVSEPIMIPPRRIIIRQSTNLLAVDDPVVASALRYIWDSYREPLSIDEIAAVIGVSRSMLTRKFRKHLGHGVNAELRRKRLECACRTLRTNNKTMVEISKEAGFSTLTNFYITFKNAFGITPADYRKGINPTIS